MTIFILIFLVLLFIYSLLIDYYRKAWNNIPTFDTEPVTDVKVSVLIAVRNEEHNLPALLQNLSSQHYPSALFEVVIIDDHSTDNTWKILDEVSGYNFQLIKLQLPEHTSSKKKAIELGVKAASGDLIIATDADCRMGNGWLSAHASFYKQTGAKFIAAPVVMHAPQTLLGIFQSLDFLTLQTITGASVFKRFHTMCNGANLSFERKVFFEVDGYDGIDDIPSGDDMLLMHKIYLRYPDRVHYLKHPVAIVSTTPQPSWKSFLNQRIRWSSKAVHYNDKRIFRVLMLIYVLNLCFFSLAIASIINVHWLPFLLLFLLSKILIEFSFVNAGAIFFSQQRLMNWFPLIQPIHILYVLVAGWLGRFGSYEWKSRVIKNTGKGKLAKQ